MNARTGRRQRQLHYPRLHCQLTRPSTHHCAHTTTRTRNSVYRYLSAPPPNPVVPPETPAHLRNHGRPQNHHCIILCTPGLLSFKTSSLAPTNTCVQVLAIGFLLVILSSALWHNYLPLLVVATYVIAPVPNWICGRAANPDDFMDSGSNNVVELGRFLTGFLVVMGVGKFDNLFRIIRNHLIGTYRACPCHVYHM